MISRIVAAARRSLRDRGFDVVRYCSVATMLNQRKVDLVLDVGANAGQYAGSLREAGYHGRIFSFEPIAEVFQQLKRNAADDDLWTVMPFALGARKESKPLHLCPAESKFSSFLKPRAGVEAFPEHPAKLPTEIVEVMTVDSVIGEEIAKGRRIFLKSDTQGYEKEVLLGAQQSLPHILGVQIEMSLTCLYESQPMLDEMIAWLRTRGLQLWTIQRGLANPRTGRTSEVDGIFFREE